jgi:hypothetical protein
MKCSILAATYNGIDTFKESLSSIRKVGCWKPRIIYEEELTKTYRWIEEQVRENVNG